MIEVARIVEDQAKLYSYRATQNEERANQLELLIETTKQNNLYPEWHPLIATPFRYNPPHSNARFRPLFGKNVFYGSLLEETALYEHAFHFIQQRMHLNIKTDSGVRTLFFVEANADKAVKITNASNFAELMDKNDYSHSHRFIESNPQTVFIFYPSCRDPLHRENAAILDIHLLKKNPSWETSIHFFYDNKKQELLWIDYHLPITWAQVS